MYSRFLLCDDCNVLRRLPREVLVHADAIPHEVTVVVQNDNPAPGPDDPAFVVLLDPSSTTCVSPGDLAAATPSDTRTFPWREYKTS